MRLTSALRRWGQPIALSQLAIQLVEGGMPRRVTGVAHHKSAGGRDGRKGRSSQTDSLGRERGTYGAPITQGAASRISQDVRRARESAPLRCPPSIAACYSPMAESGS